MARTHIQSGAPVASASGDPAWMRVVDNALLVLIVSTATLRATFIENPHIEPSGQVAPLSNEAISLLLSAALLATPLLWIMVRALAGRLQWRRTFFAPAVGIFCAAGLIGASLASDKRAALTDLAVLLSGPAAGLAAVQIFDRREKVRLFLFMLLAIGAAATYACYDKLSSSNEMLIREYEQNPEPFLETLGIEPDSLAHWQYEHRLYSRDVSGFLTTGNSAGSFFLLAVFAGIGLCIEAFIARRNTPPTEAAARAKEETLTALICVALATALAMMGMMMTRSKGAIGALLVFVPVLSICLLLRNTLWAYRRMILTAVITGAMLAIAAMTIYGSRHGRLPGGNSMFVRWQYWVASLEIAKDAPLVGVGGGNFDMHYLAHKNPAAPESIGDPHNWAFSLLCRFGLIGLAGMGFAMLRPIGRLLSALGRAVTADAMSNPWRERFCWVALLAATLAGMLLVRPVILNLAASAQSGTELSAGYLLLILIPAGIVAVVFCLLRFAGRGDCSLHQPNSALIIAIACGLGAVLLHNLVDFALFEPGVWTLFWLMMAAGLALLGSETASDMTLKPPLRLGLLIGPILVFTGIVFVFVVPPLQRGRLIFRAVQASSPAQCKALFQAAVDADPLSPNAANLAARLFYHRNDWRMVVKDPSLLEAAAAFAQIAADRSPADSRPRQLLADIRLSMAEQTQDTNRQATLKEQAYDALREALQRYPGSDILNYKIGVLAEDLNRPEDALTYLQTALDIETRYRQQFKQMYPDQEQVISRLGPSVYADLLARLERLRQNQP